MTPGSARKLLPVERMPLALMVTAAHLAWLLSACIPPPGFEPIEIPTTAPLVLLDTVYPAPLVYVNVADRGCTRFDARVELDDWDDAQLQLRWVSNDGIDGKRTTFIADQRGLKLPGESFVATRTIVPSDDFPDEYDLARIPQAPPQTVLLTLFATDGPDRSAWEEPEPEDTGGPQALGRLATDENGETFYYVVRVDWTLVLQSGIGGCP